MKSNLVSKVAKMSSLATAAILFSSMTGCGGDPVDTRGIKDQVKGYVEKKAVAEAKKESSNKYDVYFDFSDGIVYAYTDDKMVKTMNNLVQRLTASANCERRYKMGRNEITELNLTSTALFNTLMDKKSYSDILAPIEKTLDKITREGRSALLITDFEEYTPESGRNEVQYQAYAKKYFDRWIHEVKGDITFLIFPYYEKSIAKHLYLTLFDAKDHVMTDEIKKVLELGSCPHDVFTISASDYTITRNYQVGKSGCYHNNDGIDAIALTQENGDGNSWAVFSDSLEFYPFGEAWSGIAGNIKDLCSTPGGAEKASLLSNVEIDMSRINSLHISDYGVRMVNVNDDFDEYLAFYTDSIMYARAEDKTGLSNPSYSPKAEKEVNGVLEWKGTSNGNKTQVKIGMASGFNGDFYGDMYAGGLFRVDVYIKSCSIVSQTAIDRLFQWQSSNRPNTSLSQSVVQTLQDLRDNTMKNKVVYRYYVKTNE